MHMQVKRVIATRLLPLTVAKTFTVAHENDIMLDVIRRFWRKQSNQLGDVVKGILACRRRRALCASRARPAPGPAAPKSTRR
jgi:hypothetical protein